MPCCQSFGIVMQCGRMIRHLCSQASGVFVYDAHFPVPLLGRVPAAEALALAAPYGRPAVVPGGLSARLLQDIWGAVFKLAAALHDPEKQNAPGQEPERQLGVCCEVTASAAGTRPKAVFILSYQAMVLAQCYAAPHAGAPLIVAAQLVTSAAGAGFAVFAKAPSVLWPVPLHEELVGVACKNASVHMLHAIHSAALEPVASDYST